MRTETLHFSVAGMPPSVNHMYRRFTDRRGRRRNVATAKAQEWMSQAAWAAKAAVLRDGWVCVPVGTKVIVRLWFYWPSRHRRDTHNTLKALLDSWEGILYEDDYWCLPRIMDFGVDRKNPRVEAEITLMEQGRQSA